MKCLKCKTELYQLIYHDSEYVFIPLYYCPTCKRVWKDQMIEIPY